MSTLYEIALPLFTNDGADCDDAHEEFRRFILDGVGGFTELPDAHGFWMDNGKLYNERVRRYQVACEPDKWPPILGAAFRLFPDQIAIYHAEIGHADIVSREDWDMVGRTPLRSTYVLSGLGSFSFHWWTHGAENP